MCRIAQNFGSKNLRWIAGRRHFGRKNIGVLAPLQSKTARIKTVGG